MKRYLTCLCDENADNCRSCEREANKRLLAYSKEYPGDKLGQLMERAIEDDRLYIVFGILKISNLDINTPVEPGKIGSASPLMIALKSNNPKIVSLLFGQQPFDLDKSLAEYESWAWVPAASEELFRLFVSHPNLDINQADGNAKTLSHVVVHDRERIEKLVYLLSHEDLLIDLNQYDNTTPLYQAALFGNSKAVELLLKYKVDVNNNNSDNLWSVLMVAVFRNHEKIVERLLQQPEIEVNIQSDRGETALHLAIKNGNEALGRLLLAHPDIEINRKDHMGWTPTHNAAQGNHSAIIKLLLLRQELKVNYVDKDRQTPLHWAVLADNLEAAQLLVEHQNVNAFITNRPEKHTAIDLAIMMNQADAANLIRLKMKTKPGMDELDEDDDYLERDYDPIPVKRIKPLIGDPPLPF